MTNEPSAPVNDFFDNNELFWRQQAEAIYGEKRPLFEAELEKLSPEALRQIIHELRVQQIVSELQKAQTGRQQATSLTTAQAESKSYDFVPVAYMVVADNGLIVQANSTAVNLLGAHEAILGQPLVRFMARPQDVAIYHAFCQQLMKAPKTERMIEACELEIIRADNTLFSARLEGTAVQGAIGTAVYHLTLHDITLAKQTIEALRQSEANWRSLVENAPEFIMIMNREFRLTYINYSRTGYKTEDVLGRPLSDFILRDEWDSVRQRYEQIFATGQRLDWEMKGVGKGGSVGWYRVCAGPIYQGDQITSIMVISTDITANKKKDAEILAIKDRLEATLKAIPDLLFEIGADGRFYDFHTHLDHLTAWSDRLLEQTIFDILPPDVVQVFLSAMEEASQKGHSLGRTYALSLPQTERWFEISMALMPQDKNQEKRFITLCREITERKLQEEERLQAQLNQAQKMESVGRLAGGVAHDFNNTLAIISLQTELALEELTPDQPVFDMLQQIHKAVDRSADLTRQLLTFARKQTINPKVINLNELVTEMFKMLRRLIGEEIELVWSPEPSLWSLKVDASQMNQVLLNLCLNARDAISGVGKIVIQTENVTFSENHSYHGLTAGDFVALVVTDNGCGMSQEIIAQIFEPFFTTKAMGQGTGLGLAMVYGMVQQNNGWIDVSSEVGKGTTFKIYLPRYGELEEGYAVSGLEEMKPGHGEWVLLVEDEPMLMAVCRKIVERLGYQVLVASRPSEALELAEQFGDHLELLLTDVILPEMNGRELADGLHAFYPKMKILLMSGYPANIVPIPEAMEKGMNFIQKPFSTQDLALAIKKVLA